MQSSRFQIALASLITTAACAAQNPNAPRPVNVADVRREIHGAMDRAYNAATKHQVEGFLATLDEAFTLEAGGATLARDAMRDPNAADKLHLARHIISMGKVTQESAVVFTDDGDVRFEEQWVRRTDGWKLEHVKPA